MFFVHFGLSRAYIDAPIKKMDIIAPIFLSLVANNVGQVGERSVKKCLGMCLLLLEKPAYIIPSSLSVDCRSPPPITSTAMDRYA